VVAAYSWLLRPFYAWRHLHLGFGLLHAWWLSCPCVYKSRSRGAFPLTAYLVFVALRSFGLASTPLPDSRGSESVPVHLALNRITPALLSPRSARARFSNSLGAIVATSNGIVGWGPVRRDLFFGTDLPAGRKCAPRGVPHLAGVVVPAPHCHRLYTAMFGPEPQGYW